MEIDYVFYVASEAPRPKDVEKDVFYAKWVEMKKKSFSTKSF